MLSKVLKAIHEPRKVACYLFTLLPRKLFQDKFYIEMLFWLHMGKRLDWNNPQTFNEKLQWLKLYDRKPEYTTMVDKYKVREYIAERLGEEYLIPLLGVWNDPDEIDFDALPNQFVLKCNHNSGLGMCICKDKTKLDIAKVKAALRKGLKQDYYLTGREWPYKNVERKIIAEKFMTDGGEDLADYKIHNFNNGPKVILVCRDRFKDSGLTEDFFSEDWEHLDVARPDHPNASTPVERPKELEEMLSLAEKLSQGRPFLRTDFYTVGGRVYFGELTFFPASGFSPFIPPQWDETLGKWITLPNVARGGNLFVTKNYVLWVHEAGENNGKNSDELRDYKFFCFNGEAKCFKVDFDRFTTHRANYYDAETKQLLRFGEEVCPPDFSRQIDIPANIDEMICLAEKLAKGHPFLRVDFYNVQGKIYFGELTFFPASGFGKFVPEEWDLTLGGWLNLHMKSRKYLTN